MSLALSLSFFFFPFSGDVETKFFIMRRVYICKKLSHYWEPKKKMFLWCI